MKKIVMAAVLALSACMHTNAVLLDPSRSYRPVDPYDVVIYLDERDVPYEYEAIALVHARGDDDWTDEGDMLGAHAIIIEWIEEPGALEHVIDHLTHADTANRRGKVVAIRAVGG